MRLHRKKSILPPLCFVAVSGISLVTAQTEHTLALNKQPVEQLVPVIKNQAPDLVGHPMITTKTVIGELTGNWRGVFTLKPGVDAPFNFIIREEGSALKAFLVNGEERFPTGDIRIVGDSIVIPLPLFDNELAFKVEDNVLTGVLRRQDLRGTATPVKAKKGMLYRFNEASSSPIMDISGIYDVIFQNSNGKEEKAVGIFKQKNGIVTATFLRITGDSRFLEGVIEDNTIRLSSFIGSSPVLYEGKVDANGRIQGANISTRSSIPFTAVPNAEASLPDAYSLTRLKEGNDRLVFNFKDADGNIVSSEDQKFKGKPFIITIGGTWCPNCMDEAAFLGPWYKANRDRGIEIIGLQYERQTDSTFVKKVFDRFRKHYGIEYPLALGGIADKQVVLTSLPQLEQFLSFPTTIFVDKNGKVKKIHTGFSGPATGKHYTAFINDFNAEVDALLK
ncbi:MAG: TlpA family protein disulfide reductase [Chitinophagaceae bacterium]|nr:TlpA family protein disulfide reductase [Chitinophagaceae bacterium]